MNTHYTPATAGRVAYAGKETLLEPAHDWYHGLGRFQETDFESTAPIKRGYDFLTTTIAFQRVVIPSAILGYGMDTFDAVVEFTGAPLSNATGSADTIMERVHDADFGETVETKLVGFGNVSARPIRLTGTGTLAGEHDLYVTLSPTQESRGLARFHADEHGTSGWVDSKVELAPLFELRPRSGDPSLFVDTGVTPIPGFPMGLTSDSGPWTFVPPSPKALEYRSLGQTLYYPDGVVIVAEAAGAKVSREQIDRLLTEYLESPKSDTGELTPGLESLLGLLFSLCSKQSPM